jgi:ubiquinone/menaquinone biosynthesis C-methylase UbiE
MTSTPIVRTVYTAAFGSNAAENYEKYFVPVIGRPCALDLIREAGLRKGERVLDVACGTGTVTRLAAEQVGASGAVSALDANAGMLAVARSLPSEIPIKWYETVAESIPLPDQSFDVVLCGIGLQFFADKPAALREMRRVLKPGGRVHLSTPVPNAFFDVLDRAVARHVSEEASAFVHAVFSLHDPRQMESLLTEAGFPVASSRPLPRTIHLPSAREFMWQYIACTPLMAILQQASNAQTAALEREVVEGWQPWATDDGLQYEQSVLITTGRRGS